MATYYLSQNPAKIGSDSDNGGINDPWATLDHAQAQLSAGDVLYIAPGNYREKTDIDVSGDASNHIKIVGDPDCEQFAAASANYEKGVVRITLADADEFSTLVNNDAIIDLGSREFLEFHNLYIDGNNDTDLDAGATTTYGFKQTNKKYQNWYYNNTVQAVGIAFSNCHHVENNIAAFCNRAAYYFCVGVVKNLAFCIAGTSGAVGFCKFAYGNIIVGSYYGIYNCDRAYNNTGYGNYYSVRLSNGDFAFDTTCFGSYRHLYSNSNTGTGGELSGSYTHGHAGIQFRGDISNLRASAFYQYSNNSSYFSLGYDGNNGTKNISNGQLSLWTNHQLLEIAKNLPPKLFAPDTPRGAGDNANDAFIQLSASLDTDFFGHPRNMGQATSSFHLTDSKQTRRDLGAYEFSSVAITSSVATSSMAIEITDEGIHSFFIPVLSGSAMTASVDTKWLSAVMTKKPQLVLRYNTWYPSASSHTGGAVLTRKSGSALTIQTVESTAAVNVWQTLKVSASAAVQNQVYELQLYSRNTGSASTSSFSDLTIS